MLIMCDFDTDRFLSIQSISIPYMELSIERSLFRMVLFQGLAMNVSGIKNIRGEQIPWGIFISNKFTTAFNFQSLLCLPRCNETEKRPKSRRYLLMVESKCNRNHFEGIGDNISIGDTYIKCLSSVKHLHQQSITASLRKQLSQGIW